MRREECVDPSKAAHLLNSESILPHLRQEMKNSIAIQSKKLNAIFISPG
jgi:hypothetical protein